MHEINQHGLVLYCSVAIHLFLARVKQAQKRKHHAALTTTVTPGLLCWTEDLGWIRGKKHPEKSVLWLPISAVTQLTAEDNTEQKVTSRRGTTSKALPFAGRNVLFMVKWHCLISLLHTVPSLPSGCPACSLLVSRKHWEIHVCC